MELHEIRPPDLDALRVRGDARALLRSREPRTLSEILADVSRQMDEEDAELERQRDPLNYVRARRPRRNLLARLLGGRHAV